MTGAGRSSGCRTPPGTCWRSILGTIEASHDFDSRLSLWLRLAQCPGAVTYPRRKCGRPLRRLAQGNRPVIEPPRSLLADIGIGKTVRRVRQSVFQRDEAIASLAHKLEKLPDVVSLELIGV